MACCSTRAESLPGPSSLNVLGAPVRTGARLPVENSSNLSSFTSFGAQRHSRRLESRCTVEARCDEVSTFAGCWFVSSWASRSQIWHRRPSPLDVPAPVLPVAILRIPHFLR